MNQKLIILLAVLLFVGCQEDMPELIDDNRPNADGSIGFRLTVDDASFQLPRPQTRGIPHNELDSYSATYVDIYSHTTDYHTSNNDVEMYNRIVLEQEEKKWDYEPHIFWPDSKRLSFVAYASDVPFKDAGITFSPTTGAPDSLTYTVPDSVTKQPDLLVSTIFNQPKTDNIALTMKHALACISFCGDTPDKGLYVRKIALRNVYGKGKLKLDDAEGIKWVTDESSKGITVYAGIEKGKELEQSPIDPNYLMTEAGYLMMIPQKLKDAAIDVHYWNGTNNVNDKIVAYTLPIDDESYSSWKAGQKYVYKFGTESDGDITVIYYEKYENGEFGVYSTSNSTLSDDKKIVEAGYGVVITKKINNVAGIKISDPTSSLVTSGTVIELSDGKFLYPVSQSGAETFKLPKSCAPQNVYFNNSSKPCGMIIPHFAKGVYSNVQTPMISHIIRTPQQMRNITSSDASAKPNTYTYKQELDLDFSIESIGGGTLATAVVNREFNDVFEGNDRRIENVTIDASMSPNGALFQHNSGEINKVTLLNSSITSSGNTGGIAAVNKANGVITHARVIGEISSKPLTIKGVSGYTGAIAGFNDGEIIGDQTPELATGIPIAEVSGWVTITGSTAGTGGITGQNSGKIANCLVNGVHVTGQNLGDVENAKIIIAGGEYVGGIAGVNTAMIKGNHSTNNDAEPDVAGLVSITGSGNFVGGIAGINQGANAVLKQVNVRLGRGDASDAIIIKGQASVGGIVGSNQAGGTLKADGGSFISVRGNVRINGTENVGGIVGNNQTGNISNCFVYNFYSQKTPLDPLEHYAPKISGDKYVGGIVGYAGNNAEITKCAVFSTVSSANQGSGEGVANAVVEIKSTGDAVGGIVGRAFSGLTLTANYVLGNVKIEGLTQFCGGIMGENSKGTKITDVHVGNNGSKVTDIYTKLFDVVGLPVKELEMKTDGKVMTEKSGTPTITGNEYVGGICGVNWGEIDEILMNDNVKIIGTGTKRNFVGGISGGNGVDATISGCMVYNPSGTNSEVIIEGASQVGGIVGINNGIVDLCQLGMPNADASRHIAIKGASGVGGIVGLNGGNKEYLVEIDTVGVPGTGNDRTSITNCNVYGKVTIEATSDRVGGIIGQNGPTNKIVNCHVIGYNSSYTSSTNFSYDVTLTTVAFAGGIAGYNYGEIYGTETTNNRVTHTAVIAANGYSGGLVGTMKALKKGDEKNTAFEAKLYYCDVSNGVYVSAWNTHAGAFAGQIDGIDATKTDQTLFGTALGGPTNKVCTGTNPVKVNEESVQLAPPIEKMPYIDPEKPRPAPVTNLWADYQMWNYLYYTEYK